MVVSIAGRLAGSSAPPKSQLFPDRRTSPGNRGHRLRGADRRGWRKCVARALGATPNARAAIRRPAIGHDGLQFACASSFPLGDMDRAPPRIFTLLMRASALGSQASPEPSPLDSPYVSS